MIRTSFSPSKTKNPIDSVPKKKQKVISSINADFIFIVLLYQSKSIVCTFDLCIMIKLHFDRCQKACTKGNDYIIMGGSALTQLRSVPDVTNVWIN